MPVPGCVATFLATGRGVWRELAIIGFLNKQPDEPDRGIARNAHQFLDEEICKSCKMAALPSALLYNG